MAQRLSGAIDRNVVRIEHPTGYFNVEIDVRQDNTAGVRVEHAAAIRTARKLFEGRVYPHPAYTARNGSPTTADKDTSPECSSSSVDSWARS